MLRDIDMKDSNTSTLLVYLSQNVIVLLLLQFFCNFFKGSRLFSQESLLLGLLLNKQVAILIHQTLIPLQSSLRDYGRDSLGKEFRLLLNRHSKPVPVEMILALIETQQGDKLVLKLLLFPSKYQTPNFSWKV